MSGLYRQYNYTHTLLKWYGQEYSGIYLAIILSFMVIVIYNSKSKSARTYVRLLVGIFIFLFTPALMEAVTTFFWGENFATDSYMIMPTILVTVLDLMILARHCLKQCSNLKTGVFWKRVVAVTFILVMVEASVPLQWSLNSFVRPNRKCKVTYEAQEIAGLIQQYTVMLPSELKSGVKTCNWDAFIPLDETTEYEDGDASPVFKTAQENSISYVVIKRVDSLGDTNDDTLKSVAKYYGYTYQETVGTYLVFVGQTEPVEE